MLDWEENNTNAAINTIQLMPAGYWLYLREQPEQPLLQVCVACLATAVLRASLTVSLN